MLFETAGVWVESANRIATLRLNGADIAAVGRAVEAVRDCPFIEILVVRSVNPNQFDVPAPFVDDRYEHATLGRRILKQLQDLPIPTLAFVEGRCVGAGLELALACDYRLAVATPDTWLGLGNTPCWGGTARLRELVGRDVGIVTAREAKELGFVDHAFCQRRAKIELRTFLDRLEDNPRKRRRSWFGWRRALRLDADELRAYLPARSASKDESLSPRLRCGLVIELRDCPQAVPFAVEFVLRGGTIITDDPEAMGECLHDPYLRGRATPLEVEQARGRVKTTGTAKLVLRAESSDPFAIVQATLTPHCQPVRVGFPLFADSSTLELTAGTATAALADVFASAGFTPTVVPDTPRLAKRERFALLADEAVRLVAEGFPIELIDDVSRASVGRALLRTLDEFGTDNAVSLVPRLRPFVDAGIQRAFYHSTGEANTLAQVMLSSGPRLSLDDDRDDADEGELRHEIERRLRDMKVLENQEKVLLPTRRAA